VSIKNQDAAYDRSGLNLLGNHETFTYHHHHRHHQFYICFIFVSSLFSQSLLHWQRSVQDKFSVLQEHLAEEQSVLQWQLTISMTACAAGRTSIMVGFSWASDSFW